jgi:hypothetical protein
VDRTVRRLIRLRNGAQTGLWGDWQVDSDVYEEWAAGSDRSSGGEGGAGVQVQVRLHGIGKGFSENLLSQRPKERQAVVREAVAPLLEAGYTVVVDDGSSDESSKVLEGLPVVLVRHAANLGQGRRWRHGDVRADSTICAQFVEFLGAHTAGRNGCAAGIVISAAGGTARTPWGSGWIINKVVAAYRLSTITRSVLLYYDSRAGIRAPGGAFAHPAN